MQMTPTEKRLFKESVIREYKLKHEISQKKNIYNEFADRIRKIIPFNISIGIVACVLLVYLRGWDTLVYLLLMGVIWVTIISTIVSVFLKQG